ncbi:MAG: hypothetical protein HN718_00505 [Rhodospirillales bacterium]|jgi:hypothetical protein|nr:hypothetical protein [Rhodospirillales bacterium]MBT4040979.1 hypothetical protein [Rhodospirillales bacterium]MBT5350212.1 hypothetical protein [Rhodospirillales bacterium]MBT5521680.1 hypothetical protein [Rhodospirillales bacterium]MBT6111476.1 hypothetical protein [Rhodospirillales bacterium]
MLPPPYRYVPWTETGFSPSIMVDGGAKSATVLTLSHWPKSGTPENLKRDTSTEIVFEYLMQPGEHLDVGIVTGDHFDEDASLGLFALLEPDFAMAHRDLIVAAAHAGDFSTYSDRQAARIAFTIRALGNPDVSPLDPAIFDTDYDTMCGQLFREVLPRLRPIIEHTDAFEELWGAEDAMLGRSEQALKAGEISIVEHGDGDLAVVTVSGDLPCYPMAIYNATRCNRILIVHGNNYSFRYRYESWVQYITAPPPPRTDLHELAAALSKDEPGDATWKFDGVEAITPAMELQGADNDESMISVDDFTQRLLTALVNGESAWDPFDRPGDKPGMLALPH